MASTYKWADRLADWALRVKLWRRGVVLAIIGAFDLAVVSPSLASFYLLFSARKSRGDLVTFFSEWRFLERSMFALIAHAYMRRL